VEILADLSRAEANLVRLALARLPLDARLDPTRLRAAFTGLQAEGSDLDLTGYDAAEIDISLELDMPRSNVIETLDEIPKPQARPISKLGDIFRLGHHRVGCGDARDQIFLNQLREGRDAAVCVTDPPYNIKFSNFGFGKGRHQQGNFIKASGEMSDGEFYSFLYESLHVLRSGSAPSALIYMFMDWRHILELLAAGRQQGLPLLNVCVWAKANGGMGGLYRNAHELCAVFKAGSQPHRNNVEMEGSTAGIDSMFGSTLHPSAIKRRLVVTPLQSRSRCWPTSCAIALNAATWSSIRFSAPARR
jgi:hypothetical protein